MSYKPQAFGRRIQEAYKSSSEWVTGVPREKLKEFGGVGTLAVGILVSATACGGEGVSIDQCPQGYQGHDAGRPGAVLRRFGGAEADLNSRINILEQNDNPNVEPLKDIADELDNSPNEQLGELVCRASGTVKHPTKYLLSPSAEQILGELQTVGINVPPYTS